MGRRDKLSLTLFNDAGPTQSRPPPAPPHQDLAAEPVEVDPRAADSAYYDVLVRWQFTGPPSGPPRPELAAT